VIFNQLLEMHLSRTQKNIQVQQGYHVGFLKGSVLIVLLSLSLLVLIYGSGSGECSFLDVTFTNILRSPIFQKCHRIAHPHGYFAPKTADCVDSNYLSDCLCYEAFPDLMLCETVTRNWILFILMISMHSVTFLCLVKIMSFGFADKLVTCGTVCLVYFPVKIPRSCPNMSSALLS